MGASEFSAYTDSLAEPVTSSGLGLERENQQLRDRVAELTRQLADRKELEDRLRESEERYRDLFHNLKEGFAVCEMIFDDAGKPADFRYLEINPGGTGPSGLKPEEIAGKTARQLSAGLPDSAFEALGRVVTTGKPADFQIYSTVSGKHYECRAYRVSPGRFALLFHDVTDRKRAEQALTEGEQRLRIAKDAAKLGIYDYDVLAGTIMWDARVRQLWGVDPEVPITIDTFFFGLHPDDRAKTQAILERALDPSGNGEYYAEYRVISHADGSERWVAATGQVFFEQGRAVHLIGTGQDISEWKRAEAALRESEERLRMAQSAAHIGIWDWDPKTGDVAWTPEGKAIDSAAAETVGNPAERQKLVHPEDFAKMQAAGDQAIANRQPIDLEIRVLPNVGEVRWINIKGGCVYNQAGEITRVLGVYIDITDRKRLEEQLRRRLEELEKLMDVAPVAILVAHDQQGHEITGNRMANQMYEAEDGENISARRPSPIPFPRRHYFRDGVEVKPEELPMQTAAIHGQNVRDSELEVVLPSGKRIILWGHTSPLRDDTGLVRGAVGAFLDISSKKRAEEALRESEERFRNIADTAPVMMWMSDPDHAITFINRPAAVFTGLTVEQLQSGGCAEVIHPDDLEALECWFKAATSSQSSDQATFRMRRSDGEYRHMVATTTPRFIGDVYAGQIGTTVDITDIKRAHEREIDRQKLESVGTLANGIAHDFNNLLGGVLANAELALVENAEGGSPVEGLRHIRTAAIRGSEIVRQLMVYSGQESPVSELVDLSRLIEEMIELLKISVSKHVVLEMQLGRDVPAVRANPAQLRQLVMNLVINSSEAIEDRPGTIRIGMSRLTLEREGAVQALPAGEYILLEVADTGCGMTAEALARIFDPFYTTKYQGRGLGLAVVQGIVRGFDGAIKIESVPDKGTTVQVWVPSAGELLQGSREGIADSARIEFRAPFGTVLVVEDEEPLREVVSKMLRKKGFFVLHAADGLSAIEMLRLHDGVSLMLLDVTLPGMLSPQVLREARRIQPDLKVVLTSAHGDQRVAGLFKDLTFDRFIRKPYRIAEVVEVIRAALSK